MKKSLRTLLILLVSVVFLAPIEASAATSAGIKPGNFFYFIDTTFEDIGLFFTFNPEKKAKKALENADERLAEIESIAEEKNPDAFKTALANYESNISLATEKSKEVKDKGQAETLLSSIADNTSRNQDALSAVLIKVPEEAKAAITQAIEASRKGQEEATRQIADLKSEVERLKNEVAELKKEKIESQTSESEKLGKGFNVPSTQPTFKKPVPKNENHQEENKKDENPKLNESLKDKTFESNNNNFVTASIKFTPPYPIVWQGKDITPNFGGSAKFSLVGIDVGTIIIDDATLLALWNGFNNQNYILGQKVNTLSLHFKINVLSGGMVPRTIRLVSIEGGEVDKTSPPHRDYLYPNHKPSNDFLQADTTIQDAVVFFPIDSNQKEFVLTTGGTADIYFKINVNGDKLLVTKLSLIEIPNFQKIYTGKTDSGSLSRLIIKRENGKLTGNFQFSDIYGGFVGQIKPDGSFKADFLNLSNASIGTIEGDLTKASDTIDVVFTKTDGSSEHLLLDLYTK